MINMHKSIVYDRFMLNIRHLGKKPIPLLPGQKKRATKARFFAKAINAFSQAIRTAIA